MKIYTIGHSTHGVDDFLEMLKSFNVEILVDIRSYPGSKYVPHFNTESMELWLANAGIKYYHLRALGGRRRKLCNVDETLVEGWRQIAFRNYAAYALTDEFKEGLNALIEMAKNSTVCIMCAESVPWRCHRLIVSNNLVFKNVEVFHILNKNKCEKHEIGKYGAMAQNSECGVVYLKQLK